MTAKNVTVHAANTSAQVHANANHSAANKTTANISAANTTKTQNANLSVSVIASKI